MFYAPLHLIKPRISDFMQIPQKVTTTRQHQRVVSQLFETTFVYTLIVSH